MAIWMLMMEGWHRWIKIIKTTNLRWALIKALAQKAGSQVNRNKRTIGKMRRMVMWIRLLGEWVHRWKMNRSLGCSHKCRDNNRKIKVRLFVKITITNMNLRTKSRRGRKKIREPPNNTSNPTQQHPKSLQTINKLTREDHLQTKTKTRAKKENDKSSKLEHSLSQNNRPPRNTFKVMTQKSGKTSLIKKMYKILTK